MSVRRLDPNQPATFAFTPENQAWAEATIAKYPPGKQASAVIPLLWRAQEQHGGWLPEPAMRHVADMLGMADIRVYEIATFYTMFQLSPVGRKAHVQVCGTTPCMLRGAEALMEVCKRRIRPSSTTCPRTAPSPGRRSSAWALCANAPMVQIGRTTYEDLTPELFEKMLDGFAKGNPAKPGSQIGRQTSAPWAGRRRLRTTSRRGKYGERVASAPRQGPHLQKSLRPPRLEAGRRAPRAAPGTARRPSSTRAMTGSSSEMKTSGLRGRGGAGFPTGLKWSFMPKNDPRPSYLVINADKSEPGSCKDREIMRHDPHLLIEGALLASFAMRAHTSYIYVRGEFIRERERLQAAIDEAYAAKLIGKDNVHGWDFDLYRPPRCRRLHLRRGDGAPGKPRGQEGPAAPEAAVSRQRRPLRRADDRQQCRVDRRRRPTSCAAGRPGSRGWAAPTTPAPKLFQISGHVERPCVVEEEEMGIPLRELLDEHAGGVRGGWKNLLAVIPGGSSMPLMPASSAQDLPMDFDSLSKLKSGLGTAAVIVLDKSTDIIKAIARIAYFYKHESCGQCTPCREGTRLDVARAGRMVRGEAEQERDRPALGCLEARSKATRFARWAMPRRGPCRG